MYQRKRLPGMMFMASMLSTPLTAATRPMHQFPEPNQVKQDGYKFLTVCITKTKDGYTCKVSGVINYFNLNSKIKARTELMRTAEWWFENTPIEQMINKPFVTILNKP